MKLRKATIKDADEISEIEWESGYRWNKNKKDCGILVNKIFSKWKDEVYIIENNKIGIGYIALSHENKETELDNMAVRKGFQGKGYSKLLIKKVISLAKKNSSKGILLNVWSRNFKAISLYNQTGFYVIDIKKNHYKNGDNKLRMRKDL
ncbi:hypothetical protein COU60_02460 [Candidatus Pacearchaeota archaeon CG10_big_fil_rev_8_21_14_0_10_34_76]|nr:MAG: hypothetical protein COU60_02460 [Candidatus Pacearchaeota archaeon CG10_big_fil_rev_8_21_14_0_10_34_76]